MKDILTFLTPLLALEGTVFKHAGLHQRIGRWDDMIRERRTEINDYWSFTQKSTWMTRICKGICSASTLLLFFPFFENQEVVTFLIFVWGVSGMMALGLTTFDEIHHAFKQMKGQAFSGVLPYILMVWTVMCLSVLFSQEAMPIAVSVIEIIIVFVAGLAILSGYFLLALILRIGLGIPKILLTLLLCWGTTWLADYCPSPIRGLLVIGNAIINLFD